MEYGYCTGFSTNPHFQLGINLLEMIKRTGFDYVEFPLMNFFGMTDDEFSEVENKVKFLSLCGKTACNFFPGSIRLVGKEVDEKKIESYLDTVLPRCAALGISRIILGSGPARTFGPDQSASQAYGQFASLVKGVILPKTKSYGMTICIEPFEKTYCNLIVSALEGLKLVEDINDSSFMLMVDLYHMLSNGEDINCLKTCYDYIRHIHVAGPDRIVPSERDVYIWKALEIMSDLGYDGSLSFETEMAVNEKYLSDTLEKVRNYFGRK